MQLLFPVFFLFLSSVGISNSVPFLGSLFRKPKPADPATCKRVSDTYTKLASAYELLWRAEVNAGFAALSNEPAYTEQSNQVIDKLEQVIRLKGEVDELRPLEDDEERKIFLRNRLNKLDEAIQNLQESISPRIPKSFRVRDITNPYFNIFDLPPRNCYAVLTLQHWEGAIWKVLNDFWGQRCKN